MLSNIQSNDSLPTRGSLLAAAIGSDPEAWQQLVTLYQPRMSRWCRGQGLDQIATMDVIQEAWISVARGLASFRSKPGAGAFRAWLHQIVRRRIADYRRREVLLPPAVGGSTFAMRVAELPCEAELCCDASASSSEQAPVGKEHCYVSTHQDQVVSDSEAISFALHQAMAKLRCEVEEKTWQAFWLCVVDQRSTEEVANSLAMTAANVRQCRSRVLRRLRRALEES